MTGPGQRSLIPVIQRPSPPVRLFRSRKVGGWLLWPHWFVDPVLWFWNRVWRHSPPHLACRWLFLKEVK